MTSVPLSELTALLTRELAESAKTAERRQRDAYVALAAEFGVTREVYRERVVGATIDERRANAVRLVDEAIATPSQATARALVPIRRDAAFLVLDDAQREHVAKLFGTSEDAFETAESEGARQWVIRRDAVEKLALEKLEREADARYRDARAVLSSGLPKALIRGGSLEVKVVLSETASGVVARLAGDQAGNGANVSTLTLDFNMGAFPPFEP